jgi:hypothetical protein
LLSVPPYNRDGRLKANADGAALVDKGPLGGNPLYDVLGVIIGVIPQTP